MQPGGALRGNRGVTALYHHLRAALVEHGLPAAGGALRPEPTRVSTGFSAIVPPERVRYLAEVASAVRRYHQATDEQVAANLTLPALARHRRQNANARDLLTP